MNVKPKLASQTQLCRILHMYNQAVKRNIEISTHMNQQYSWKTYQITSWVFFTNTKCLKSAMGWLFHHERWKNVAIGDKKLIKLLNGYLNVIY